MRYSNIERVKAAVVLADSKFTISDIANALNEATDSSKYKVTRAGIRDILRRLENEGELFSAGWRDGLKLYTRDDPTPQHHKPRKQPGVLAIRTYTHNNAGQRVVANV